eukprot:4791124-Prorocentrum_lima.AAC.1
MTSSLVGSEMCIRDRACAAWYADATSLRRPPRAWHDLLAPVGASNPGPCLLYTSDAADDM